MTRVLCVVAALMAFGCAKKAAPPKNPETDALRKEVARLAAEQKQLQAENSRLQQQAARRPAQPAPAQWPAPRPAFVPPQPFTVTHPVERADAACAYTSFLDGATPGKVVCFGNTSDKPFEFRVSKVLDADHLLMYTYADVKPPSFVIKTHTAGIVDSDQIPIHGKWKLVGTYTAGSLYRLYHWVGQ